MPKEGLSHKIVTFVDVEELLSFAKGEYKDLEEQVKEEERIEGELKKFVKVIEKNSGHKIGFIGHEKRYGVHIIRYVLENGGLLEFFVEKPLSINAHFLNQKEAEKFVQGLKKALQNALPETKIKEMYIDSVKVEDAFKEDVLTIGKWERMHRIAIHRTVVITIIAIAIFIIMEITKALIEDVTIKYFDLESIIISVIGAVTIALFFEPLKHKVDRIISKILGR